MGMRPPAVRVEMYRGGMVVVMRVAVAGVVAGVAAAGVVVGVGLAGVGVVVGAAGVVVVGLARTRMNLPLAFGAQNLALPPPPRANSRFVAEKRPPTSLLVHKTALPRSWVWPGPAWS